MLKPLVFSILFGIVAVVIACLFNDIFSTEIWKTIGSYVHKKDITIRSSSADDTIPELYNIISANSDKLYTKDTISKYTGEPGSPGLYLAILGRVYDVSAGEKHYGPGGGYAFFSGKDGTKAYMTGEFNEKGLIDETVGLTNGQMLELENWIKFYDKTYTYIGKLIGNFYDKSGEPTEALYNTIGAIKVAYAEKKEREAEKLRFPPCNSQSKKGEYRRVFCSQKSGGIQRSWVGYPRRYFTSASDKPRCVCVNNKDLNHPHVNEYENCDPTAISCSLPPL